MDKDIDIENGIDDEKSEQYIFDLKKQFDKILKETNSINDRISFLKETGDINKKNILNEIVLFKKLIVIE